MTSWLMSQWGRQIKKVCDVISVYFVKSNFVSHPIIHSSRIMSSWHHWHLHNRAVYNCLRRDSIITGLYAVCESDISICPRNSSRIKKKILYRSKINFFKRSKRATNRKITSFLASSWNRISQSKIKHLVKQDLKVESKLLTKPWIKSKDHADTETNQSSHQADVGPETKMACILDIDMARYSRSQLPVTEILSYQRVFAAVVTN